MRHDRWDAIGLRTRVKIAYIVLVTIAVIGIAFATTSFRGLSDARIRLTDRLTPASIATGQWTQAMLDQERGVRGFVLTADPTLLEPYEAGREAASEAEDAVREALAEKPELHPVIDAAASAASAWQEEVAEPLVTRIRTDGVPDDGPALLEEGSASFERVRDGFDDLQARILQRRTVARQELVDRSGQLATELAAIAGLLAVGIVGTWFALNRWVLAPLNALGADARLVADGDLDRPITATGPPDLRSLGDDVEAMRERIVEELAIVEAARARLEAQAADLERSNEELEQFAYVASHDLQEPLRKVTGFCQLLERRYKGQLDEKADEYIAYAVDGAKRMQLLINDLLAFSRVGRTTDRFVPVHLREVAARAVATMQEEIDKARATVEVRDLPTVPGDATLLELLFQNLIGNAVKFRTEDPPVVTISARRDGALWHLTCRDNGIGIEPQFAERVFVIFQRLNDRKAYGGTGIGLALCRKVVEFHGGTIEVEASDEPGTTIHWTLPAERAAEPTTDAQIDPHASTGDREPDAGGDPLLAVGSPADPKERR